MEQGRAVWVAELADRAALVRLIRAALLFSVAPVDLPDTHVEPGLHVLQLRFRGTTVALSAELAGETATVLFALRLAPLDPSHVPELITIAERTQDELQAASRRPPERR